MNLSPPGICFGRCDHIGRKVLKLRYLAPPVHHQKGCKISKSVLSYIRRCIYKLLLKYGVSINRHIKVIEAVKSMNRHEQPWAQVDREAPATEINISAKIGGPVTGTSPVSQLRLLIISADESNTLSVCVADRSNCIVL